MPNARHRGMRLRVPGCAAPQQEMVLSCISVYLPCLVGGVGYSSMVSSATPQACAAVVAGHLQ